MQHVSTRPLLGCGYRQFRSSPTPTRGVLDGDLLQQFLELSSEEQGQVCGALSLPQPDTGASMSAPFQPMQVCEMIDALNHFVS